MGKKTKVEKLRQVKKRRQSARRFGKFVLSIAVVTAIFVVAAYAVWRVPNARSFIKAVMRGNSAGGYDFSSHYKQVDPGKPVEFAGGKVTVESLYRAERLQSAFGGGLGNEPPAVYEPKRGLYLVALVTFQGDAYAETGTVDPGSVRLVDENNEVFVNKSIGSPAQDLYMEAKAVPFGQLELMNTTPQRSLLLFDVPSKARGLLVLFLREEEGVKRATGGVKVALDQLPRWSKQSIAGREGR